MSNTEDSESRLSQDSQVAADIMSILASGDEASFSGLSAVADLYDIFGNNNNADDEVELEEEFAYAIPKMFEDDDKFGDETHKSTAALVNAVTNQALTKPDAVRTAAKMRVNINNALSMLCAAFFEISYVRRLTLKNNMDQKYHQLCTRHLDVTEYLFGDDVSKKVKDVNNAQKMKGVVSTKSEEAPLIFFDGGLDENLSSSGGLGEDLSSVASCQTKCFHSTSNPRQEVFLFYKRESPLSNFYAARFKVSGKWYSSTEQFYIYKKVDHFNNQAVKAQILKETDPAKIKRLGRRVKIDAAEWERVSCDIMKRGIWAKFSSDKTLKRYLKATYPNILAESNPTDLKWGTGYGQTDPNAHDPKLWRGRNLLGKALMELTEDEALFLGTGRNEDTSSFVKLVNTDHISSPRPQQTDQSDEIK
ncbi:unnamed protein product [Mytilus coruscus]|uniref:NADAR domain-containing protein n=1 Tax=Mytilus coruscus TaxID=42192 RepID=A0A6J8ESL9_MYTCO|nr:unnamed protein product [Mytilus coruscus]